MKLPIVGAAVCALAIPLVLTACQKSEAADTVLRADSPESECISSPTLATVKSILFDNARKTESLMFDNARKGPSAWLNDARKAYKESVVRLGTLESTSTVTVDRAVLSGNDKDIKKVTCEGRLMVSLPIGYSYNTESILMTDINYTVQPTADGKSMLVSVDGVSELIGKLVNVRHESVTTED